MTLIDDDPYALLKRRTPIPIPYPPFDPDRIYDVPIDRIENDENWNCRGYIDPTSVIELATDIRLHGLQLPVELTTTKPDSEHPFKLVAGYRRFKAHEMNNAETIRATIKPGLSETECRFRNLTENLQRSELNMKQEAHALKHLQFLPKDVIASRINKAEGWVASRLALLLLPDDIQNEAAAGRITSTEVFKCSKLPSIELQYAYVRRVKDGRLTGRKTEVKPDKLIPRNETRLRSPSEIEEMQTVIRECFGNGIATVALGWSGGFVDDLEFRTYLRKEADAAGKPINLPEGL